VSAGGMSYGDGAAGAPSAPMIDEEPMVDEEHGGGSMMAPSSYHESSRASSGRSSLVCG
jgi:hypothetical protein